jgi:glutaredoxin
MVVSGGSAPGGSSDAPAGASDGASHSIVLYGLSTCVWCRKMKEFLEREGVVFEVVHVDELSGAQRDAAVSEVRKWNPAVSFPTVVIDGVRSVNGYRPDEVKEVLGL